MNDPPDIDLIPNADTLAPERPNKRQRSSVARQACERCRLKKTRCDEEFPCGLCRSLEVECLYNSRNTSHSDFLRILSRFESTLETISARVEGVVPALFGPHGTGTPTALYASQSSASHPLTNPSISQGSPELMDSAPGCHPQITAIPFSAHQVISWSGVVKMMPDSVQMILAEYGMNYAITLESARAPLQPDCRLLARKKPTNFLSQLMVSTVKELCDSYFSTFHLTNPILDRSFYQLHTLSRAIDGNFGNDIESCVVLVVMALGSLGQKGLAEAGFEHGSWSLGDMDLADSAEDSPTELSGILFFNESRKRIGWLINDNGLQSCQYYLLAGLFYSQLARPVDSWSMTTKASTCCRMFWMTMPVQRDTWVADMQSRLFWIALMSEAILTKELSLPDSGLQEISDQVPLPRFLKLEQPSFVYVDNVREEENDSLCHYYFLAQTALRILLTRTSNCLFFTNPEERYSLSSIEEELTYQLEQWRNQLPAPLQFDEDNLAPLPESPKDILVVSWLRARYMSARYHFGRPLLHRVLSSPEDTTIDDLRRCTEIFHCICEWEPIVKVISLMRSCMPLRFNICAQLFGQLLIIYCFRCHADGRLQQAVPSQHREWCIFALSFLQDTASCSPSIAKDAEIASLLWSSLT